MNVKIFNNENIKLLTNICCTEGNDEIMYLEKKIKTNKN